MVIIILRNSTRGHRNEVPTGFIVSIKQTDAHTVAVNL